MNMSLLLHVIEFSFIGEQAKSPAVDRINYTLYTIIKLPYYYFIISV